MNKKLLIKFLASIAAVWVMAYGADILAWWGSGIFATGVVILVFVLIT